MHAQMSSFMRFFSQRTRSQVYKNVDRAGMFLVYVMPIPIARIINMPIESGNGIINTGWREERGSNLIWGSNPALPDAIDKITEMTKNLVNKTGRRAQTLTQNLQNPK